jgi:hypothetical protein
MKETPPERVGLVVMRVWVEPSAQRAPADAVRARITTTADLSERVEETFVAAGTAEIVACLEQWLAGFAIPS